MADNKAIDVGELAHAVRHGDRRALARAVTLVESTRDDHRLRAEELLSELGRNPAPSLRIGISGTPGVGKSTFIECLGMHVVDDGRRLAVLTIDPSSAVAGGSILGDKTRMVRLASREDVFIRPSPSGAALGGVARRSGDVIALVEAAGFDCVIVETVGVGQSETTVAQLTDIFLLLLAPAAGDELQGIKRGIVEIADLIVVNKADGALRVAAEQVAAEYANAMGLWHVNAPNHPNVEVLTCSALNDEGVLDVWRKLDQRYRHILGDGTLQAKRAESAERRLWDETLAQLAATIASDKPLALELARLKGDVGAGKLPVSVAARTLVKRLISSQT